MANYNVSNKYRFENRNGIEAYHANSSSLSLDDSLNNNGILTGITNSLNVVAEKIENFFTRHFESDDKALGDAHTLNDHALTIYENLLKRDDITPQERKDILNKVDDICVLEASQATEHRIANAEKSNNMGMLVLGIGFLALLALSNSDSN